MSALVNKVTSMTDRIKRGDRGDGDKSSAAFEAPLELGSARRQLLVEQARRMYRARHARQRYLPANLFGEPAWEILLVLYIEAGQRPMNATSVALITNAPETTALRWAEILQDEGLVESYPHLTDRRLRLLQLSLRGRAILDQYLQETLRLTTE